MARSRYRESRILVRRFCRLPGQQRDEFNRNVHRLRQHFESFIVDVSELCQWLMSLRKRFGEPGQPSSFGLLGDFLLEPQIEGIDPTESDVDSWRLDVFDAVAGFRPLHTLGGRPLPAPLREAMQRAAQGQVNHTSQRLFERMCRYDPAQRFVLLKAAAEWVVARYQRPMLWWAEQRPKFEAERQEWEAQHPPLTPEVREQFTHLFQTLIDPDQDGRPGVYRKNPRICRYDRLKEHKDNCAYGEKGHGPLCWKYAEFVNACKDFEAYEKKFRNDPRRKELILAVRSLRQSARSRHEKFQFQRVNSGRTRIITSKRGIASRPVATGRTKYLPMSAPSTSCSRATPK